MSVHSAETVSATSNFRFKGLQLQTVHCNGRDDPKTVGMLGRPPMPSKAAADCFESMKHRETMSDVVPGEYQ